jgi:hypothetical protein
VLVGVGDGDYGDSFSSTKPPTGWKIEEGAGKKLGITSEKVQ